MNTLQNRITDLEEERQELLCKLDQYDELKTKNGNPAPEMNVDT